MAGKFEKKRKMPKGSVLFRSGLLLLLAVLTAGGIGTTAAKYIRGRTGQTLVKAPEFYFTSDLLAATTRNYVLNSSVSEVTFTLSNSADDLRCSEVDITYTVSSTAGELNSTSGSLTTEAGEAEITLRDMVPGATYTVTATGDAGYSQTLSANFIIAGNDENVYKHLAVSDDGTMLLTVWTHNVEGTLSVVFPKELIPDNTNVDMGSVFNRDENGAAVFSADNFGKYSSQTYRFFHSGSAYTEENFKVSVEKNEKTYAAMESKLP